MFNFFKNTANTEALKSEKHSLLRALRAHMKFKGVNSQEVRQVERRLDEIERVLKQAGLM